MPPCRLTQRGSVGPVAAGGCALGVGGAGALGTALAGCGRSVAPRLEHRDELRVVGLQLLELLDAFGPCRGLRVAELLAQRRDALGLLVAGPLGGGGRAFGALLG